MRPKPHLDNYKATLYNSHMYKKRLIEQTVIRTSKTFPVVMLTGCRQAGKTTLFRMLEPNRQFVSLDDLNLRRYAREDPKGFIGEFKPPVFIDEFQYAPDILPYIKMAIDEKRTKAQSADGDYWLSGSQNFKMMEHVSESLAGRVAILQLLGFNRTEVDGNVEEMNRPPFFLAPVDNDFATERTAHDIFEFIVKGDKPEVWTKPEMDRGVFYSSYIQTYLERDVRNQLGVKDLGIFEKFMRMLAARSADLLNLAALSSDVGVSQPTISQWLTVMERSYQVFLLKPYYKGHTKRYVKTPKVYFLDTGLLSYFLNINDAKAASTHHFNGKLFETWVVSETIKSFWHRGLDANIFLWRTRDGDEIDLVYEGEKLLPAEVKLARSPSIDVISAAKKLKGIDVGQKRVICTTEKNTPLASDASLVSAWNLF